MGTSVTRDLWELMKADVVKEGSSLDPEYFLGFSHACWLCGVIDGLEFEVVQNTAGDLIAAKNR